jgi:hypothetical protein
MHSHQIADATDALEFIFAGNATFTTVSQVTGTRFTFKVRKGQDEIAPFFAAVLSGPDNGSDFEYLGFIPVQETDNLIAGRKGKPNAKSFKALQWVLRALHQGRIPAALEIWHEGRCGACGRKLTVPSSIETGMGPECARKKEAAL